MGQKIRNGRWKKHRAKSNVKSKPIHDEENGSALRAFRLVEFERKIAFISKTVPDLPFAFPDPPGIQVKKQTHERVAEASKPADSPSTLASRLLELPTEIQLRIFTHLLKSDSPYPLPVNYKFQPSLEVAFPRFEGKQMLLERIIAHPLYPRPHILHAHPTFYAKFLPEYYRMNTWQLDIGVFGEQRIYPDSRGALYDGWPHDRIPVARDFVERLHVHTHWGGCGTWADVGRVACFPRLRELVLDLRLGGTWGMHIEVEKPMVSIPAPEPLKAALRAAGFVGIREEGVECLQCQAWEKAQAEERKCARCVRCLDVWVGEGSYRDLERRLASPGVIEEIWQGVSEEKKKADNEAAGKPEKIVVGYQRIIVEPQFIGRGWGED